MQLSIIIVNYNVKHYLALCLDSVYTSLLSLDAEVIVVDNASVDGSQEMLKEKFPEVRLISNPENVGFSAANNQGVAMAKGTYVCILNPDTVVAEDTFTKVYEFAESQQNPGAIGVQLVDGRGNFLPESKRNVPTPKVSLNKIIGDGAAYYASDLAPSENGEVAVLVGAFMFIKRSVYNEVDGFDERYFMYGEDIDLSYTIQKAGYTNFYMGEQSVIHFKGESTIKDKIYRTRFYGAMRLFYDKHMRKNAIESVAVKTGLLGAKLKSGLASSPNNDKQETFISHLESRFVFTDNELLVHAFAKAVSKPVTIISEMRSPKKEEEFIFDASYISYKDIIKEIITHSSRGATYKIIPKNSTFAVGSNSSEGRGEIIDFNMKG